MSSVVNLLGYRASSQVMTVIEFVHPSTGNEVIFLCGNDSHDAIWALSTWNISHIPGLYRGLQSEYLCQGCFHVLWKKETNMKRVSTKGLKSPSSSAISDGYSDCIWIWKCCNLLIRLWNDVVHLPQLCSSIWRISQTQNLHRFVFETLVNTWLLGSPYVHQKASLYESPYECE